jgi:hypothetical protein
MKIIPYKNKIQVEMLSLKGALQTEIKIEKAKVLAVSKEVEGIKVGDMLYVKAWAIDIITDGGKEYNFVDASNDAICAIIRE